MLLYVLLILFSSLSILSMDRPLYLKKVNGYYKVSIGNIADYYVPTHLVSKSIKSKNLDKINYLLSKGTICLKINKHPDNEYSLELEQY